MRVHVTHGVRENIKERFSEHERQEGNGRPKETTRQYRCEILYHRTTTNERKTSLLSHSKRIDGHMYIISIAHCYSPTTSGILREDPARVAVA
jgi:hypothetical protein